MFAKYLVAVCMVASVISACGEATAPPEVMPGTGQFTQVEGEQRAAFLAMVEGEENVQIVRQVLVDDGCQLNDEAAVVLKAVGEEANFTMATVPGTCEDGATVSLNAVVREAEELVAVAHRIHQDGGEIVKVETIEIVDQQIHYELVDSQTAGFESACETEVEGLACQQNALSAETECRICRSVASFVIGQGRRACGWGAAAVCGALSLAGGAPGVVCFAATWALCRYGIRELQQWGSREACRRAGYCQ